MGRGYICDWDKDRRKPCAKCGSANYAYESDRYDYRKKRWMDVFIICRDCGHRSHTHRSVEAAREEWNNEYRQEGI